MVTDVYNFCTYFDTNYLTRGLSLYRSLHRHCAQAKLWILCMDSFCYEALLKLNLPNVTLIRLEDFERGDIQLTESKSDRTSVEYYFTCTPSLILYLFQNYADLELLTYIDSDFFFFSDPTDVLVEVAKHSISITPHQFPTNQRYLEKKYGIYNVGWITFRRDQEGMSCLSSWRKQCIEWCYDRVENGRFGDQMYLDDWPNHYSNLKIINHIGINLAPFNLANYNLTIRNGMVFVNEAPLICFHFFGLKKFLGSVFYFSANLYGVQPTRTMIDQIYEPYLRSLSTIEDELRPLLSGAVATSSIRGISQKRTQLGLPQTADKFVMNVKHWMKTFSAILSRRFIVFLHGRVRFKFILCGLRGLGL